MNHHFSVEIAIKHGINKAVLIENIAFWINHNQANNQNFKDGSYWTYNSAVAFSKIFPYMASKSIDRWMRELERDGVIKSAVHNESFRVRTKWYTIICPSTLAVYTIPQNEESIPQNEESIPQNEESLTDNKPYSKPINKQPPPQTPRERLKPITDPVEELSEEEGEIFDYLKTKIPMSKDFSRMKSIAKKINIQTVKDLCAKTEKDIEAGMVNHIGALLSRCESYKKTSGKSSTVKTQAERIADTQKRYKKEDESQSKHISDDPEAQAALKGLFDNIGKEA